MTAPQASIKSKLQEILATREYEIPEGAGFEGTGAPGLYLEHLLDLKTSNLDIPDAGAWEVKFTSGNALLTLFHKTGDRGGPTVAEIIEQMGIHWQKWPDRIFVPQFGRNPKITASVTKRGQ